MMLGMESALIVSKTGVGQLHEAQGFFTEGTAKFFNDILMVDPTDVPVRLEGFAVSGAARQSKRRI